MEVLTNQKTKEEPAALFTTVILDKVSPQLSRQHLNLGGNGDLLERAPGIQIVALESSVARHPKCLEATPSELEAVIKLGRDQI